MNGVLGDFFGTFLRNRGAAAGLAVLALVGVAAATAGLLFPYSPWDMRGAPFMPPGQMEFLLGSDSLGRDVAAGIAYGARVSLLIGAVSTVVAVLLGITLGAVAGYAGAWSTMRSCASPNSSRPCRASCSPWCWWRSSRPASAPSSRPSPSSPGRRWRGSSGPSSCRCARAEFVHAAEVLGRSRTAIVFRVILTNALSPIIVLASLMVAGAILLESGLSFLGLGDPNLISWGFMIGAGRSVIRIAWWMSVFPGIAIFLTVLALNLVGEGLSDALNPRLARRR